MKRNKQIAAIAAGCLALSSISVPVFAENAGSYTEVLRELEKEAVASLEESYKDFYDKLGDGFAFEGTTEVTLGDSVALLAQTMGLDITWLDSLVVSEYLQGLDDKISEDAVFAINGTEIATLSGLYDFGSKTAYAALPEIIEQDFSLDLNKALELAASTVENASDVIEEYGENDFGEYLDEGKVTESAAQTLAVLSAITSFNSLKEIQEGIPSPEVVSGVYAKLVDMVLEHLNDGGSQEVTLNVNGVTQDGTSYTATMGAEEAIAFTKDLVLAMKDSELVEILYTQYLADTAGTSYDDFAAALGEAAEEIETMDPSELGEDYEVEMTITVDADGNVIGETSKTSIEGEEFVIDFQNVNDGTKEGLLVKIDVPESMTQGEAISVVISGNGDVDAEGTVTGEYTISVNNQPLVDIQAANVEYDKESGNCAGSLTFSLIVPEDSEDFQMALFGAFAVTVDFDIAAETETVALTVSMSGADLVTATFELYEQEAPSSIDRSAADFEPAVDVLDQEALEEAAQNINPGGILDNLVKAGMPGDFIENVMNLINGGGASSEEVASVPAA